MKRRQLNPRQRQGMLLVVIACAGLLGVLLLIANYVSSVSKQVGPKTLVLTLVKPLQPYQPVTTDVLGEKSLPVKWVPSGALRDPAEALGLITQVPLPAGTELEQGMLTQPPALQGNEREIAILVDAETGVAGQLTPGSLVDVIATYGSTLGSGSSTGPPPVAEVVVAGVKLLGVGMPTSGSAAPSVSSVLNSSNRTGTPVTLALTPAQVLKVSFAETFAQKVRLSLVAPGFGGPPSTPSPYAPKIP